MSDELAALIEELEALREQAIGDKWQLIGMREKAYYEEMITPNGDRISFPQGEVTGQFKTAQEGSMRVITPYKKQVEYINLLVKVAPRLIEEVKRLSEENDRLECGLLMWTEQ